VIADRYAPLEVAVGQHVLMLGVSEALVAPSGRIE
jgi:hypothetical protein